MITKRYYVYITSNERRTVYYVGITSDINQRMMRHKTHFYKNSFTSKYNVNELLYTEEFCTPMEAIRREKELKGWTRKRKIQLIKSVNPELKNQYRS